jgi:hypothetical protein
MASAGREGPALLMFDKNPNQITTANIYLEATDEGPRLELNDRKEGFRSILGVSKTTVVSTGEERKRSAASLVFLGRKGTLLWSAP